MWIYQPYLAPAGNHREWSGLILLTCHEFGHAARRNRGRYSGAKTHALTTEYVVGVTSEHGPVRGDSITYQFVSTGRPAFFSAHPLCGCTQGQRAGSPSASVKAVTCSKCQTDLQRIYAGGGETWGTDHHAKPSA